MADEAETFTFFDLVDTSDELHGALPVASAASLFDVAVEPTVPIALEDLLPDASGDVVLSAPEGMTIELHSNQNVVESGVIDHHVTASGLDVTGFEYCSFASGMTVYYPHDSLVRISFEILA